MSDLSAALAAYLKSNLSVAAYPGVIPMDTKLPVVGWQKIGGSPMVTHSGYDGSERATYQLSAIGKTYAEVRGIANELRSLLSGYAGAMGVYNRVVALIRNERDMFDDDAFQIAITVELIA